MTIGRYVKRVCLMLFVALPVGALLLTIAEMASSRVESPVSVLGGAIALVYVWGAITGTLASVAHTALMGSDARGRRPIGLLAGAGIGAVAGAATPTLITGFFRPGAVLLGLSVGVVYVALIPQWDRLIGKANTAV